MQQLTRQLLLAMLLTQASGCETPSAFAEDRKPCPVFGDDDRQHCMATCDSDYNTRTANLEKNDLFACARTRDIARANFHEDDCHKACDRDHNPDSFDEGQCHRDADHHADDECKKCGKSRPCQGHWCSKQGAGRSGLHQSCSGRKNQIKNDRDACHRSCSGVGNVISNGYDACKASVDGKRNAAEMDQKACYRGCSGKYNFSQECVKKGSVNQDVHYCTCEVKGADGEATGQSYQAAIDSCKAAGYAGPNPCTARCAPDIGGDCN